VIALHQDPEDRTIGRAQDKNLAYEVISANLCGGWRYFQNSPSVPFGIFSMRQSF
jgi:hypothetical protein